MSGKVCVFGAESEFFGSERRLEGVPRGLGGVFWAGFEGPRPLYEPVVGRWLGLKMVSFVCFWRFLWVFLFFIG